jgi:hypothetical protein
MELFLGSQTAVSQNTTEEIQAERGNVVAEFHIYSLVVGIFCCKVQNNVTDSWHPFLATSISS